MGGVLWGRGGSAAKHVCTCDRPGSPNSWGPIRYFLQLLLAAWTLVWGRMLNLVPEAREPPMTDFLDSIHVWEEENRGCMSPVGCLLFQRHQVEGTDLQPWQT